MEELGIGRPSTYASTIAVLRDRDYVRIEKKRLIPEDKGRLVTAFLESFFAKYVGYDFTADLEEKLDRVSNSEIDWKALLRDFWNDFSAAVGDTKDLRTGQVLDSLNELLGPHIFPARGDGVDPRLCPSCGKGQLSLKLGKFGAFIGCSNYPECKFTRVLAPSGAESGEGDRPGVRVLGQDPETGRRDHAAQRPVRRLRAAGRGREAEALVAAEGPHARRRDAREGAGAAGAAARGRARTRPAVSRSWPASAATAPTCSTARPTPISAVTTTCWRSAPTGRSTLSSPRRAAPAVRASAAARGRALGDHPEGGAVSVKQGRFGSYVNHGKLNATLPKGTRPGERHARRGGGAPQGEGRRRRRVGATSRRASRRRRRSRCATAASGLMSTGARSTRRSPSRRRRTRLRSRRRLS